MRRRVALRRDLLLTNLAEFGDLSGLFYATLSRTAVLTRLPAVVTTVPRRDLNSRLRLTYGTARRRILTVRSTAVAVYGTVDNPIPSPSRSFLSSSPYLVLFLPDMPDRRSKSSGKDSVRVVASGPQQSSSAPTRRHVAFRADHSGRLQQSVSYSHSEEPVPDDNALPLLLEVMDDGDEDEAMDDLADAMEDQFFGSKDQVVPEKSRGPVRIVSIVYSYRFDYLFVSCC